MTSYISLLYLFYTLNFCKTDKTPPYISEESPIHIVTADQQFNQLTKTQQSYAYYLYFALWESSKIAWFQTSFESPALFLMFQLVLNGQSLENLRNNSNVTSIEFNQFLTYVSSVFTNCGNYKSFGGTKFIPQVNSTVFSIIIKSSNNYQNNATYKYIIDELYNKTIQNIYNYNENQWMIDFPPLGQSGYYTQNLIQEEINFVDQYLSTLNINPINTRIFKVNNQYRVLVASNNQLPGQVHNFQNKTIIIHYGDFSIFLQKINHYLQKSIKYASNQNEINMINDYIKFFDSGNFEDHLNAMRQWIKNWNPSVEIQLGFTETYQDPKQVRGLFSGFISLINKNYTQQVKNLLDQNEKFLKMLPWPREFEMDRFIQSEFACINIIALVGEGMPNGINLPNDQVIKQNEGFKNFLLVNSIFPYNKTVFISEEDASFLKKYFFQRQFHIIVFHELFGHGSGKLFQKFTNGSLNYDPKTINPLTGLEVGPSCYSANQTMNDIFQNISNPLEECRADTVALYFSCLKEPVLALQPELGDNWEDLRDTVFIRTIYTAILGLEIYDDQNQKWGEAHVQGNWVIFQALIRASDEMISIEQTKNKTDGDWINIKFKRELFKTIGCKVVKDLLVNLQVLRATADIDRARIYFEDLSQVNEKYLKLRQIVIDNRLPRYIYLQGNIKINENGDYQYVNYPENFAGIVQSYIDRFPDFDYQMYEEWRHQYKYNQNK